MALMKKEQEKKNKKKRNLKRERKMAPTCFSKADGGKEMALARLHPQRVLKQALLLRPVL